MYISTLANWCVFAISPVASFVFCFLSRVGVYLTDMRLTNAKLKYFEPRDA
jgi:hypothetical protein